MADLKDTAVNAVPAGFTAAEEPFAVFASWLREAEGTERAGVADGGHQRGGRSAARHRRLNYRQACAEQIAQWRVEFHYRVASNNSRPINQRRISEVPAPIS